jgi:hypothetical protein
MASSLRLPPFGAPSKKPHRPFADGYNSLEDRGEDHCRQFTRPGDVLRFVANAAHSHIPRKSVVSKLTRQGFSDVQSRHSRRELRQKRRRLRTSDGAVGQAAPVVEGRILHADQEAGLLNIQEAKRCQQVTPFRRASCARRARWFWPTRIWRNSPGARSRPWARCYRATRATPTRSIAFPPARAAGTRR